MAKLFAAFFLTGLTGGFGHCTAMCYPFVLYISSKYSTKTAGYKILIPHLYYNFGRIITYSFLGGLAGFLGSIDQYTGEFINIQKSASVIGGAILVIYAIISFFKIKFIDCKFMIIKYFKNLSPAVPLFYGIILGFLPCGLSMGAVIGAASSGNIISGAFALFFFGLGTSVSLLIFAVFGNLLIKYSKILDKVSVIILLFMGCYFLITGLYY